MTILNGCHTKVCLNFSDSKTATVDLLNECVFLLFMCTGTNLSISNYGFSGRMGRLCDLAKQLKGASDESVKAKLQFIKDMREHFTYRGAIAQLEKFFKDPLGADGGDLRCARMPERAHRNRERHRQRRRRAN
jgi:hypothetical protein